MLNDFPFQAIRKAAELGEYTLTDFGTWCAVESTVRDELEIFVCVLEHPANSRLSFPVLGRCHGIMLATEG